MIANHYSLIDLFAGCGGLSLGLENSGFTPVFVNELNDDAMATYLSNRFHSLGGQRFSDNQDLHCGDAHDLKGKRIEQLKSDLSIIKEIDIRFHPSGSRASISKNSLDLVVGGPPCQGYSGIGLRRSYAVDKKEIPSNRLYRRMVSIIRELMPRIFLFENVYGLITSTWVRGGNKIWPDVLRSFRSIPGYEVRWKLVRSHDYGVPQNRPRILLVGIRQDIIEESDLLNVGADHEDAVLCGFLPPPRPGEFPHLVDLLGDLEDPNVIEIFHDGNYARGNFETVKYPSNPQTKWQKMLRVASPGGKGKTELTEHQYSKHKPHVVERFRYMLRNNGAIPEHLKINKFAQRLLRPRWEQGQDPGITVASLPDDYVHYSQPRSLTVREWARLQMIPDWYQFKGNRTTGGLRRAGNPREGIFERDLPKYTQIGNAVPVELARRVGVHFKTILDEYTT